GRRNSSVADCGALAHSTISTPRWRNEGSLSFGVCRAVFFRIVTSLTLPVRLGRIASTTVARAQTKVLSETRHGAGLTLLRVLRRGLELGECLGVTARRADSYYRDCPPHPRPGTGSRRREATPHRRLGTRP